jgi:isocitrate dehydrogenase (NAD+)
LWRAKCQQYPVRPRGAIDRTINEDKIRNGDLGGSASTHTFAEAVAKRV